MKQYLLPILLLIGACQSHKKPSPVVISKLSTKQLDSLLVLPEPVDYGMKCTSEKRMDSIIKELEKYYSKHGKMYIAVYPEDSSHKDSVHYWPVNEVDSWPLVVEGRYDTVNNNR